jgi:hypothetical protein
MGAIFGQPIIYPAPPGEFQTNDLLPAFKFFGDSIAPVRVERSEVIPDEDELSHLF